MVQMAMENGNVMEMTDDGSVSCDASCVALESVAVRA